MKNFTPLTQDYKEGVVLAFDKPLEWTSFNLVSKVRRILCQHLGEKKLKVGHAGTLDPLATGVLLVCTGRATKTIDQLQADIKEYVATLQLGSTTASFDLEKPIDATYPTEHINRELIETVLARFIGRIEQIPPAFSAVKVDGKRAYDLARKGKEVELKPKTLIIDEIEILGFNDNDKQLTLRIVCSKGTYIRALARDIGTALNSGAHLISLRRTRIGKYNVEDCLSIEQFEESINTLKK